MPVVEDLTEEEAYLYAILMDESGIDLAEFSFVDEENDDGCFRCWPFQWAWWRDKSPQQIDQCARSVGKSMSILVRACIFPFVHPGAEMVITGPEGIHVDAITDKIETSLGASKLTKALLKGGRESFKHKPFYVAFNNGAHIMGRIPQRDGRGVKGIHPLWLEQDEAQDYPPAGWTELAETLKRGSVGAIRRVHGVTRGVRDEFYELTTNPNKGWKVHRFTAMHRPNWTDEERQEKIAIYGGRDDPDYRRNVLGLHGDAMSPLFVLARLMNCVDDEKESSYNADEYMSWRISDAYMKERGIEDIRQVLDFPMLHTAKYKTFWAGMDVGFTQHPSEILVFAEELLRPTSEEYKIHKKLGKAIPPEGLPRLKLLTRINLTRIGVMDQVRVILWVIDFYKPRAFSLDKTGNGLPLFQEVQEKNQQALTTVRGYGFSEKVLVDFDQSIAVPEGATNEEMAADAGIRRNTADYATDQLRSLVDGKRLWLPYDEDLLNEFRGQTFKLERSGLDQYGKRSYSQGKFHALDAARMAVLGWKQYSIEQLMAEKPADHEPVLELFGM